MAKKEEKKSGFRAKLLSNLHFQRDLSLHRQPPDMGRIKWVIATFAGKGNLSKALIQNVFLVVFLVPAIVLIAYLLPQWRAEAVAGLNFSQNFGLGFSGIGMAYAYTAGAVGNLEARRRLLVFMIPAFTALGIGMAGSFYVMRNYSWRTPVKLIHFLRGMKMWHVIDFAIAFTAAGAVAYWLGTGIIDHRIMVLQYGGGSAGNWVSMVFAAIVALLLAVFLLFYLPHRVAYKMSILNHIRNSAIYSVALFPLAVINIVAMAAPLVLFAFGGFLSIIAMFALATALMAYYVLWITNVGQYAFDQFNEAVMDAKESKVNHKENAARKKERKITDAKPHKSWKKRP